MSLSRADVAGRCRLPRVRNLRIVGEKAIRCRGSDRGRKVLSGLEERQLTVQKTFLFYPGDGFPVYEHHRRRHGKVSEGEEMGELVFRVDSYDYDSHHVMGRRAPARDEVVLLGPCGDCILTVRRKGYWGKGGRGRRSIVGNSAGIFVEVYGIGGTGHRETIYDAHSEKGSTLGEAEEGSAAVVAEIRRKVVSSASSAADVMSDSMVLGRDVFCLRLAPGFDAAFSMGLVLVLDQITGDKQ
ncbi:unnamed protein product [Spirodela intermedia]|uniref:Uncharacterized protein n=1 Tax=Spirodela intermedia TaxID=51605 RepID=A0A7I8JSV5_SPIIN|nr:unnamed protein product [Spirodela intermedia]CAA6673256.1 unnamed protein product [Spirodela intermedia]